MVRVFGAGGVAERAVDEDQPRQLLDAAGPILEAPRRIRLGERAAEGVAHQEDVSLARGLRDQRDHAAEIFDVCGEPPLALEGELARRAEPTEGLAIDGLPTEVVALGDLRIARGLGGVHPAQILEQVRAAVDGPHLERLSARRAALHQRVRERLEARTAAEEARHGDDDGARGHGVGRVLAVADDLGEVELIGRRGHGGRVRRGRDARHQEEVAAHACLGDGGGGHVHRRPVHRGRGVGRSVRDPGIGVGRRVHWWRSIVTARDGGGDEREKDQSNRRVHPRVLAPLDWGGGG